MEQRMKPRTMLIASAVAVTMLAGCSSGGSGGGSAPLKLEKTNIVVNAFPAIDSAGLYIAKDKGLFAAQGLNVTIVPVPKGPPPSTQNLIDGQVAGHWDITAGDYVTYIQNDIGTLLIDSLLVSHGLNPQQIRYTTVPFPGVADTLTAKGSKLTAAFAPEPFVSFGEAQRGLQELADLDQGSTQDFPIQGYAVTAGWAQKYPNTLKAFTTALAQGQQIADTDRAAVEAAIEKYLRIDTQSAAFISLPAFPLTVDAVRLQRVVSTMTRFDLLPKDNHFKIASMITG